MLSKFISLGCFLFLSCQGLFANSEFIEKVRRPQIMSLEMKQFSKILPALSMRRLHRVLVNCLYTVIEIG